jgi:hypothetical protein
LLLICKTHKLQNSQIQVVHRPLNHWSKPGGGKALSMTFFANLSKSWRQLLSVGLICSVGAAWSDLAAAGENDQGKSDTAKPETAQSDIATPASAKEGETKDIKKPGSESPNVEGSGHADPEKNDSGTSKPGAEKKNERKAAGNKAGGKKPPVENSAEKGKSNSPDQNAGPVPEKSEAGKKIPEKKDSEKNDPDKKGLDKKDPDKKDPDKKDAGNDANRDRVKGNNPKGTAAKTGNLKGVEITPDLETQALEFAGKQHPELVGLISPLKTTNPKEYQRAVRELFRTSERLDNIRQREPARYELELEAWKLQSHVRLLAARLVMEPEPELQKSLKDAIRQKADNHVRLLQFEKETLKNRLEQIDRNIEKSSKSLDQTVDQEYERLLKQASRDKPVVQKLKKAKANPEVPKVESGVR